MAPIEQTIIEGVGEIITSIQTGIIQRESQPSFQN